MNDIFKASVKARINQAMEKESLNQATTAKCIGIAACYVSMIKNDNLWHKVPPTAWEAAKNWVNSGQGLKEYEQKHGKVLAGTSEPEGPEEHSPESVFGKREPTPETVELKIEMGQKECVEQVEMIPLNYYREQTLNAGQKIRELTAENERLKEIISQQPAFQVPRDVKVNLIVKVKLEVEP